MSEWDENDQFEVCWAGRNRSGKYLAMLDNANRGVNRMKFISLATVWWRAQPFRHNTPVWQTDGRTAPDGQTETRTVPRRDDRTKTNWHFPTLTVLSVSDLENPHSTSHRPTTSTTFFSPVTDGLWPMTLTFELDLDSVKMNQRANWNLYYRSFSSKIIVRTHRHTHTHRTDCCAWTTKVVGNTVIVSLQLYLGFVFAGVVRRNGGRFLFVF